MKQQTTSAAGPGQAAAFQCPCRGCAILGCRLAIRRLASLQEMRSKPQAYLHDDVAGTSDDRDFVGENECNAHCRVDMPSCSQRFMSAAFLWSGKHNCEAAEYHAFSSDTDPAVQDHKMADAVVQNCWALCPAMCSFHMNNLDISSAGTLNYQGWICMNGL